MNVFDETKENLISHYHEDQRPWVIAYSGGKDSTLVLQLVYELLAESKLTCQKEIHIIASDTRVEAPNIDDYLQDRLTRIAAHANANGLPVAVHCVQPEPDEGFWGNLIGKGYPSPTRWFRWCTSKMKIKPSRKVIEDLVRKHGSVVLLLGTRMAESSKRAGSMEARETNSRGLNPHHEIPNSLVFTPIANWSTDAVWEYLCSHNPPPWGGGHDFMLELYRQASGGECPVILDLNQPSCGGSRFGCWTCTVVKEDKSMLGFIESGETWMLPLNKFRNWLKELREDPAARDGIRRNERVGPGLFNSETRKTIFRELLKVEQDVHRTLISDEEIAFIQFQWAQDFDVSNSAFKIAAEFDREMKLMSTDYKTSSREKELIDLLSPKYELNNQWVKDLLHAANSIHSEQKLREKVELVVTNAIRQTEKAEPAA